MRFIPLPKMIRRLFQVFRESTSCNDQKLSSEGNKESR